MSKARLLPAHAWRSDPDQLVSDHSRRLLAFLNTMSDGLALDAEDVAAKVAVALRDLMDAHAVVVLGRESPSGEARLLGIAHGGLLHALDEGFEEEALLPADAVLDVALLGSPRFHFADVWPLLPVAPFWWDGEPATTAETLKPLCDWARNFGEMGSAAIRHGDLMAGTPALVVPLPYPDEQNATVGCGLALLWISTNDGFVAAEIEPLLLAAAAHAAQQLGDIFRWEKLALSHRHLAELLGRLADERQRRKKGHAAAVAYYCRLIAREMGLGPAAMEQVELAGLLCDLGKARVPDAILHKQEALSRDELEQVRNAVVTGADWLAEVEGLSEVAHIIRHQNELWDGSGLPSGMMHEAIPLGARILAVALRFAAMTQPRADRGPRPVVGGALDAVATASGKALDPQVVEAFLAALGRSL